MGKNYVVALTGLSRPNLHIIFGLVLFVAVYIAVQRPWLAWGTVLTLELINEANDLIGADVWNTTVRHATDVWADSLDDLFHTMAIPTVLACLIAFASRKPRRRRAPKIRTPD